MLHHLLVAAAISLPLAPTVRPVSAPPPAKGEAAKAAPIKLFDGTSLSGWKPFLPEGDPAKVWSVRDGVLVCAGTPIGYIQTEKEFTNYELNLKWRFDPAKGEGNSGVLLRVVGPDVVWPKSMEAQLHSKNAGDIWNIGEFPAKTNESRTQGRRTVKINPTNEKPLGEWNEYRIVMNGGTLELYVNGLLQNRATDVEIVPGRIGLQSEGAHIEFKDIVLTPLP
jgi:hypothetical protein